MRVAHEMRVEIVHVRADETASVALPRITLLPTGLIIAPGIAVESAVEEVERLVGEDDVAVGASEAVGATPRRRRSFGGRLGFRLNDSCCR